VNEAMEKFDEEETQRMQAKLEKGQFSFEDFIKQMQQIKKLGPIGKIMGMIPGMNDLAKGAMMNGGAIENQMKKIESIYNSMTKEERKNPDKVETQRRRRIAAGSGTQPPDVAQTLKQFGHMRDMMKAMGGGMMGKMKMAKAAMGGGMPGMGGGGNPMGGLKMKKGGWMEKKDRNKKR
jgi:signal recognition particle subunit SRP54